MKKLIIAASMLMAFAGYTSAQTAPVKTETKTSTHKTEVNKQGQSNTKTTTSKVETAPQPDQKTTTVHTSKTQTKSTGPVKSDGTPDKRYKANKTTVSASATIKKDGTPDKRYKENKKVQ